jgi:hypothetical protein
MFHIVGLVNRLLILFRFTAVYLLLQLSSRMFLKVWNEIREDRSTTSKILAVNAFSYRILFRGTTILTCFELSSDIQCLLSLCCKSGTPVLTCH